MTRVRLTAAMLGKLVLVVKRAVLDDWMWVRAALVAFCGGAAYLIWFAAFGRTAPQRQDLLPLVALAAAVFGVTQGILRWIAVPDPAIEAGPCARFLKDAGFCICSCTTSKSPRGSAH